MVQQYNTKYLNGTLATWSNLPDKKNNESPLSSCDTSLISDDCTQAMVKILERSVVW
jgi:hypothetical protein